MKHLFVFFICLPSFLFSTPENFSFSLTPLPESISFDEELRLSVEVQYPITHHIDFQNLRKNLVDEEPFVIEPFALKEEIIGPQMVEEGVVSQKIDYVLNPWIEGKHSIGFLSVPFYPLDGDGEVIELFSELFDIVVHPSEEAASIGLEPSSLLPVEFIPLIELDRDNRAELTEKVSLERTQENQERFHARKMEWRLFLLFLVCCLFFVLLFPRLHKVWQTIQAKRNAPPSPREVAREALYSLKKKEYPAQGLFEIYYVSLTEIVRKYIEEEFRVRAPERTTEEFLQEISSGDLFDNEMQKLFREFLFQADSVKFACLQPSMDECYEAERSAESFLSYR